MGQPSRPLYEGPPESAAIACAPTERAPDAASATRGEARRRAGSARRGARARRWAARALVVAAPLAIVLVDVGRRGERLVTFGPRELAFYVASAALGVVLWTSLIAAATRRRGPGRWPVRAALALLAVLAVGGQIYTFTRYGAYLNHRAMLVGTSFLPSVGQQLWFDRWTFLRALAPCVAVALAVPWIASRLAPMRARARGWLAIDLALASALGAAFVSPEHGAEQGQPPDVMYVSAMGQLLRAHWDKNEAVLRVHPGPRSPEPVPAFVPKPTRPRSVLMIITESVRAQSVCLEYTPDCAYTPFSNEVVRDRIALTQMRSLASTTAISVAVMWSGLHPSSDRRALHTAPLLWEYARAAGRDTAYYTSQHLLFGNSGLWLEGQRWTRHVSATHLDPDATYEIGADDGALLDHVLGDIDALEEPFFAVVHLSNTHFPYKYDPDDLPFVSRAEASRPASELEVSTRYHGSIHRQDKALGRFLRAMRGRPAAARTVTLFTSDHGEQMREKGSVGHTSTLYDPEIRVPFWVHAPAGTLTAEEEASLRALRETPTTHLDVFPTVMDLLGFWDAPELASFRARAPGESLLRGGSPTDRAVALTNCTELWACAFKNWGAIRGTKKLIAHQGDRAWSCFDVALDPTEDHPLDLEACADLVPVAEGTSAGARPF